MFSDQVSKVIRLHDNYSNFLLRNLFKSAKSRKMFLLTKTKRPKKVHCNIIYSRKRFLKIKRCSAERRSES